MIWVGKQPKGNCLDRWNPFWCINIPKYLLLLLSIVLIYVFILFLPEAQKLCSLEEDFGRMNKRRTADFRSTFQGREYSIWTKNHWKVLLKSAFRLLFLLPKSSLGRGKKCDFFARHTDWILAAFATGMANKKLRNFMLQKRRFWKAEQEMKSIFPTQWFIAQIEYSRPWKVLRNPDFIFCSSFQNLRLGGINFAPTT